MPTDLRPQVKLSATEFSDKEPRYGGPNGGPLKSSVTDPIERIIREAFDQFDNIYLSGKESWLSRQRTGRLCEALIKAIAAWNRRPNTFVPDPDDAGQVEVAKAALCSVPSLFLDNPEHGRWNICRWGNQAEGERREIVLDWRVSQALAEMRRDALILELRAKAVLTALRDAAKGGG